MVAAERAEGVDSHLDVGIGGQSGEHVRDGCRGESSRLGIPAAQGTRRERADVNVLVTEGEKHPRRGGRCPQAAEGEDGTPAHRGIGVVHERQEIGDRGVGPESPRLQHDLSHSGFAIVLAEHDLAAEDTGEEAADSWSTDLGECRDGLDGRGRLECRQARQAIDDGLHRRAVSQHTEGECGAHADRRVRVGEERDDERCCVEVADTTRCERGDAPDEGIRRHHATGEEVGLEVARVLRGDERRELLDHRLFLRGGPCRMRDKTTTKAQRTQRQDREVSCGAAVEKTTSHYSVSSVPLW